MTKRHFAILGTVGVPGNYGGFETLADNLVQYHEETERSEDLTVYCSSRAYPDRPEKYLTARLRYVPLDANGAQSIPYDIYSLFDSARRADVILLLGVSGALVLPLLRLFSKAKIVTNIDGIEWKREKWRGVAKYVLRISERFAVRYSHEVIADNAGIADHVKKAYGKECHVIAYGGDHAVQASPEPYEGDCLPNNYALALCRIEPENNVHMILEAFSELSDFSLVFVGNWNKSAYGRELRAKYGVYENLYLLDPVYAPSVLRTIRDGASMYIHGHSAGGTNPSLVEMMHFGIPVVAHGCCFNRYTTEDKALYFTSSSDLKECVRSLVNEEVAEVGCVMKEIAENQYTWPRIGKAYFDILES